MLSFREVVDDLMIRDLGYIWSWYTLESSNSASPRIRERLDCLLCSASWFDLHSRFNVEHTLQYKSYYMSIVLIRSQSHNSSRKKRCGFVLKHVGFWMTNVMGWSMKHGVGRLESGCLNLFQLWLDI